jgi:hypothetical protein
MGHYLGPYSTTVNVIPMRRQSTMPQEVMTVNTHRSCKIVCQITNNHSVTCSM